MNNAKRGKISPFQFFAILTVSRIVVSLTYIQSVTVGIMSFDIALGLIFAAFFTMILSIPHCTLWLTLCRHTFYRDCRRGIVEF